MIETLAARAAQAPPRNLPTLRMAHEAPARTPTLWSRAAARLASLRARTAAAAAARKECGC